MKKLKSVGYLFLALALLLSVTSCGDMLDFTGGSQGPTTQPSNPNDNNPTTPTTPVSYHDYPNFNTADYVIINESGKSDDTIADLRDEIWLMYAEKEYINDWLANYVKKNNIKTILSNEWGSHAWIDPNRGLDSLYLSENIFNGILSHENQGVITAIRKRMHDFATHETMHLVQYKSGAYDLMIGMRPDICAAVGMLAEYLADFYTSGRYPGTDMTVDMKDAVATQSKYMILSTDPDAYDAARAKDPSLPPFIFSSPWFKNVLGAYAEQAFYTSVVRRNAFTSPLREASEEDMMKVARAMLACRDPKKAGVTDDALWTVFDALRRAAVGDSKYLTFGGGWGCSREAFDEFQELIALWEDNYAVQQTGTRSVAGAGGDFEGVSHLLATR